MLRAVDHGIVNRFSAVKLEFTLILEELTEQVIVTSGMRSEAIWQFFMELRSSDRFYGLP